MIYVYANDSYYNIDTNEMSIEMLVKNHAKATQVLEIDVLHIIKSIAVYINKRKYTENQREIIGKCVRWMMYNHHKISARAVCFFDVENLGLCMPKYLYKNEHKNRHRGAAYANL